MSISTDRRPLIIWLLTGCALIFVMVMVGGITRLTGSGLSITEWNVVGGALPPLNEQAWNETFEKYRQTPQFQKVNFDMDVHAFKSIFWWEYIHRLLGRLIGVVFIVPFCWFLWKKKLEPPLIRKLIIILLMGGLQGVLGWYMVQSGLVDNPRVSHYRLAAHLFTALITFLYTLWVALSLMKEKNVTPQAGKTGKLGLLSLLVIFLVLLQVIYGAFVAGLHAGRIFTTFPMMGDQWIADAVTVMEPWWKNIVENPAGVQFMHRYIGSLILVSVLVMGFLASKESATREVSRYIRLLFVTVCLQVLLGIITLLYSAPLTLALLHQAGAVLVLTSAVVLYHEVRYPCTEKKL